MSSAFSVQKILLISLVFSALISCQEKSEDPNPSKENSSVAYGNPWEEGVSISPQGRSNPLAVQNEKRSEVRRRGLLHTQFYPVEITGSLPPYEAFRKFFDQQIGSPWRDLVSRGLTQAAGVKSFDGLLQWLGLHEYPWVEGDGVYTTPWPEGKRPSHRMGIGFIPYQGATGFSFSCTACHSSQLFGKTVMGMTNRFPRANELFLLMKRALPYMSDEGFRFYNQATPAEVRLLQRLKKNTAAIGIKKPVMLGLDTSLAQVALSLSRRNPDAYATKNPHFEKNPRPDFLDDFPADSKPAVWWNLKYKNRWLSDGSVISGNPIFTNILWNEIGRGTDLRELEAWLNKNKAVVEELTTAVFSSEAPRFTDFFSENDIDLASAKRGEKVFNNNCARCHGQYLKAWSQPEASSLSLKEQITTTQVIYFEKTRVVDVGTDPSRAEGMKSLERLNDLAISKNFGIRIQKQKGYVPPPLVGIWARWPYFHNNSVPSLCAVLTLPEKRPWAFYQGEASSKDSDFDQECNGYPLGDKSPVEWRTPENFYDTRRPGMSNAGHDEGILRKNGIEVLSASEKKDLIRFLQTL